MNPEAFLQAVRGFEEAPPVLSISLDLSMSSEGRPTALQVLNAAGDAATDDLPEEQDLRELINALQDDVTAAMDAGALGYISIIASGDDRSHTLTTPVPFRNSVRVGPRPWLFEFERLAYFAARPVVYARVSRSDVHLVRVAMADLAVVENIERNEHFTRNIRGRTNREGRGSGSQGGIGAGGAGGHGLYRMDRAIEEERAAAAREAAERVAALAEPDDIILVDGPQETRFELVNAMPERLRERVEEPSAAFHEETDLVAAAVAVGADVQLREAGRIAANVLSGAPVLGANGREAVSRALNEGRVDQLVIDENAVGHWGTAMDAREHRPGHDDGWYNEILTKARETSADIRIASLPDMLEQQQGVVATLRW